MTLKIVTGIITGNNFSRALSSQEEKPLMIAHDLQTFKYLVELLSNEYLHGVDEDIDPCVLDAERNSLISLIITTSTTTISNLAETEHSEVGHQKQRWLVKQHLEKSFLW